MYILNILNDHEGEWMGLYLNNELLDEGHSLQLENVFHMLSRKLGGKYWQYNGSKNIDLCLLYDGRCPEFYDKWEIKE